MKRIMWSTALAATLALLGVRGAAALTCGPVISDDGCKDTRKCEATILGETTKYAAVLQKKVLASQDGNLAGKNVKADNGKACVGGSRTTKSCVSNGGACKDGARKGKGCDPTFANGDCPGYCNLDHTITCQANIDCGGNAPCKGFAKGCDAGKGCDVGTCEILNKGPTLAGNIADAGKSLRKNLNAKCDALKLADLGFPNAQCKGKCSTDGSRCAKAADCTGVSPTCDIDIDTLVDCVEQGMAGDVNNARAADGLTTAVTRLAASVQPAGAKTNKTPRKRSTVALPNLIQIAVKSTQDGAGSAGGSSPTGLARCVGAGPMTGEACLEDKDCQGGPPAVYPSATCVEDCCTCTGLGVCAVPNGVGSLAQGLCTASPAGQVVCEGRGNQVQVGNLQSQPTENASNGIGTCLVTHLARVRAADITAAGFDNTDKGHCSVTTATVCDADADCPALEICRGGVNSIGALNLTTGTGSTIAPISTEVFLKIGGLDICPKCNGNLCTSGPGTSCSTPDGTTTGECPPEDDATNWSSLGLIPNPFNLGSGKVSLTAATSVPANGGWPAGKAFCGKCSLNTKVGCSTDGSIACPTGTGSCTTSGAFAGYRGDVNYDDDLSTSGQQASAVGIPNLYAGTAAGIFCSGSADTGGLVDSSVGLPGPVRVLQPYIVNYTFSGK